MLGINFIDPQNDSISRTIHIQINKVFLLNFELEIHITILNPLKNSSTYSHYHWNMSEALLSAKKKKKEEENFTQNSKSSKSQQKPKVCLLINILCWHFHSEWISCNNETGYLFALTSIPIIMLVFIWTLKRSDRLRMIFHCSQTNVNGEGVVKYVREMNISISWE